MTTKFFCPLPWIHQFVLANGIKMCCSSRTKLDVTPTDFANSDYIKNIRATISNGDAPNDCQQCVQAEARGYTSTRSIALKDWNYTLETVPDQVEYLDLRHSNLCNFSCRTCEPTFSSEIAREITNNSQLSKYHQVTPVHITNTISQPNIKEFLPNIKRINFTGGEPLLIKETTEILKELIAQGNTACELLITTNASVMNHQIVSLLRQFTDVHWTISIDAVGNIAEYIRNGSDWNTIENNVMQILRLKHSVGFNCVLSAYSVLDISRLVTVFGKLKEQYSRQPLELWFAVCENPYYLNPLILTGDLRSKAVAELGLAIDQLELIKSNPLSAINTLKGLQSNLIDSKIVTAQSDKFVEYTKDLDIVREQNFNDVFKIYLYGDK